MGEDYWLIFFFVVFLYRATSCPTRERGLLVDKKVPSTFLTRDGEDYWLVFFLSRKTWIRAHVSVGACTHIPIGLVFRVSICPSAGLLGPSIHDLVTAVSNEDQIHYANQ
jgi:hypothetical protein